MQTYREISDAIDDFVNIKNFVGNTADAEVLGTQGGYDEEWLTDYFFDDALDATSALEDALAQNKTVYIPKGIYRITRPVNLKNASIVGDGRSTILMGDPRFISKDLPLFYVAGTSIKNVTIQYNPRFDLYRNETPGPGKRVLIQPAESTRMVNIEQVWMYHCGTAIRDYYDAYVSFPYFSCKFDTINIQNFRYRAIDLTTKDRTGNVFTNIYASFGGLPVVPGNLTVGKKYNIVQSNTACDWKSMGSALPDFDYTNLAQTRAWMNRVFTCTNKGSPVTTPIVNGVREDQAFCCEVVDGIMSFGGVESEGTMSQLNCEGVGFTSFALNFSGQTGLCANSIHFEKATPAYDNLPFININSSIGSIGSISIINTPIYTSNNAIIKFNSINATYCRDYDIPQTANHFRIGTLNLTSIGTYDPRRTNWWNLGDVVGLKLATRNYINNEGSLYFELKKYYWTTFDIDDSAYKNLPIIGDIKVINDGIYGNEPASAQNNSFSTLFMTPLRATGPANNPTFTDIPTPKVGQVAYANTNKLYVWIGSKWKLL